MKNKNTHHLAASFRKRRPLVVFSLNVFQNTSIHLKQFEMTY